MCLLIIVSDKINIKKMWWNNKCLSRKNTAEEGTSTSSGASDAGIDPSPRDSQTGFWQRYQAAQKLRTVMQISHFYANLDFLLIF